MVRHKLVSVVVLTQFFFLIRGSVHRNSRLNKSNEIQQYAAKEGLVWDRNQMTGLGP